jgi:hypothetical protein
MNLNITSLWSEKYDSLAIGNLDDHIEFAMKSWSLKRLFLTVLGVFLALGLNLSAIHANGMMLKMAMSPDMISCEDCSPGREDETTAGSCLAVCIFPTMAVHSVASNAEAVQEADFFLSAPRSLRYLTPSPEPDPPRPNDIA